MILYRKIQSALSKINGNTLLIERVEDRGYDEYFCTCCKQRVTEDSYNHKHKVCYTCWFDESDHTRQDDGDAPEVDNDN